MVIMDETQESKTSRPSGVAWTFRIRWDDSQAIIRTWQILPWRLPAVDFRDFTMAECFLGVLQGAELQRTDLLVHVCVCVVLDLKIWDNKTLWRRNSFLWSIDPPKENATASEKQVPKYLQISLRKLLTWSYLVNLDQTCLAPLVHG